MKQMSFVGILLHSAGTAFMVLLLLCNATENQLIKKELFSNCSKEISTVCCPFESFSNLKFHAEHSRIKCNLCPLGTYCLCTECEAGHEALSSKSTNCTKCRKGFFKAQRNCDPCERCPGGYFASRAGQVNCTLCPVRHYCKAGATYPLRCESYHACPAGTETPVECSPIWFVKYGDECRLSTALITVISIFTGLVAIALIALIICKLYRCCRRRRYAEIYDGETERLLPGRRPGTRILREPVYTGL